MRYFFLILICTFITKNVEAQIYEVGVVVGGSNFIGDVGATDYISPNELALGVIAKWNRSPRHSYRASVIFSDLKGVDRESDDPRRKERDYKFNTSIVEISLGMEFTFLDFDLHTLGPKGTPYLYSGLTLTNHDNYYFATNGEYTSENTSSWAVGIPMVLGYKTKISNQFILAAEIGARYTFSDELDGSVPDSESREQFEFGNTNNTDWYMFTGITLTYTFGRRPCYCKY
ncbi:type IX secretion system protein PorG [Winogradskyella sp. PC D3.3]